MTNKLTTIKAHASTLISMRLVLKWGMYLTPIALCGIDAYDAYDLEAGANAVFYPIKKMFNDYYPTAILLSGGIGAFLNREGDLRDKMFGFGKGAVAGWAVVTFVKTIFAIA